jgi:hypothetical protein
LLAAHTMLWLWVLLAACGSGAAADKPCSSTGQGWVCREAEPGFIWQPPQSAPSPDPLFAGNATALWLRTTKPGQPATCAGWYAQIESFMLARIEQNGFLSTAIPGCGHVLSADGSLLTPSGADAQTLARISGQMRSLKVAITPVVSGSSQVARAVLHSAQASLAFVRSMASECARHAFDGVVLEFDLADFAAADDGRLGAMLIQLRQALGRDRSVAVAISGARPTSVLSGALNGSGVIVHITEASTPAATGGDVGQFDRAVAAAVAQFGAQTSIGLTLRGWWGGTGAPSITDVTSRLGSLTNHNVAMVALDVDWASPDYQRNQAVLDLWQLGLMSGFRGGAGIRGETLSPPRDGSPATRAAWGAGVQRWRASERRRLGFERAAVGGAAGGAPPLPPLPYDDPQLNWTRRNFVSPQVSPNLCNRLYTSYTLAQMLALRTHPAPAPLPPANPAAAMRRPACGPPQMAPMVWPAGSASAIGLSEARSLATMRAGDDARPLPLR